MLYLDLPQMYVKLNKSEEVFVQEVFVEVIQKVAVVRLKVILNLDKIG